MLYDLIIIGGGPAGVTAGIYGARQRLKTLLISKEFGGQMARKTVEIENYPGFSKVSGAGLIKKFEGHLRRQQIEIRRDEVAKVEKNKGGFLISTENKGKFKAKTVIVASGADPRPLEVPGEKEFIGKGISYCTACDGPVFARKTVAVVGGGDAGFEAAIFLAKIAKKVYILEHSPQVKASPIVQEMVRKSRKVELITSASLKEIKGTPHHFSAKSGGGFVESIIYEEVAPSSRNHVSLRGSGSKKTHTLAVEGVFIEIGSVPATGFVKGLVDFNRKDEIKVDPRTCATKTPGLFAAGDVTDVGIKQIVVAAGQGCKAALGVYNYLNKARLDKTVQSVRQIY